MCSACSCDWDNEAIGDCVMRDRVARSIPARGNICRNCDHPVEIGQRCIDHAGLYCNGGGWFARFHEECFLLMELFAERMCRGNWCYPFCADEAAEHAMANADDPYWRRWLEIYERTWEWTEPPADPIPRSAWVGEYRSETDYYLATLETGQRASVTMVRDDDGKPHTTRWEYKPSLLVKGATDE